MRWCEIFENTTSGSIATAVNGEDTGGIGAGFDPNGDWGVYQSAKRKNGRTKRDGVIRRAK